MSLKTIEIQGNSLEPTEQGPDLPLTPRDAEDARGTKHILIQSRGLLNTDQKLELQSLGVHIQTYVAESTYLCEYSPDDLAVLRAKNYILYANVYLEDLKASTVLKDDDESAPAGEGTQAASDSLHVNILFHQGVDASSDAIKAKVAEIAHVDVADLNTSGQKAVLKVEKRYLQGLAAIDEIRTIEKVQERKLFNNVARGIIKAEVNVNNTSYHGSGQTVAVADTGFDKGNKVGDVHPAFTNRVSRLYPLGKSDAADPESVDDEGRHEGGHGTHVCGSVLGDGVAPHYGGKVQGTAPQASLVMQALADANGSLGYISSLPSLGNLFTTPYDNDNVRIHTNSWGIPYSGRQIAYSINDKDNHAAMDIDHFIWTHKDMTICFAAGNDGRDPGKHGVIDLRQLGSESAAKNCITVGASESLRPNIALKYWMFDHHGGNDFPSDPIKNDLVANDPEGMAAFSSRGPTAEGRIKPDVTAPGTTILSTRARSLSSAIEASDDPDWTFMNGTSMATPLVAGCVAVLRETLVKNGTPNPPAALLKALLINGAVDMKGQYQTKDVGPSPNPISGWGRVDLAGSVILPGSATAGFGIGAPLREGEARGFTIKVPSKIPGAPVGDQTPLTARASGLKLKITLVWTDPVGPLLQNNLNLIVRVGGVEERHGNMGTDEGFDTTNNVEQVSWDNVPSGDVGVTVSKTDNDPNCPKSFTPQRTNLPIYPTTLSNKAKPPPSATIVRPGSTVNPTPVNGVIDGLIAPVGTAGVPLPINPVPDAEAVFARQALKFFGSCPRQADKGCWREKETSTYNSAPHLNKKRIRTAQDYPQTAHNGKRIRDRPGRDIHSPSKRLVSMIAFSLISSITAALQEKARTVQAGKTLISPTSFPTTCGPSAIDVADAIAADAKELRDALAA
ncbi:uncharacterized protein KY384_008854 [Bacidia gigantensis]|uniref:uncharacterized protein n=1 Tax=Bacidia gigantensis TaxID=2732470 RepID=UPI001D050944|nr:uncharacterized protein KY384_008854 [Bacidia gigantensis]KAG8525210.1 hypothetical protein KY384_008854 [Bacidia gigantensis]